MKTIEVDDELYQFIASRTEHIGESASNILRRLLGLDAEEAPVQPQPMPEVTIEAESVSLPESAEEIISAEIIQSQKGAVGRFLAVLAALYRWNPNQFVSVLEIQGRKPKQGRSRKYFALSEAELQSSGNSTAPKQIADSPYWVITNTNTEKKRTMVGQVASKLQLPEEQSTWLAQQI